MEINGAFRLKFFGNFQSSFNKEVIFPQVIKPMQDGKFIFYPQYVSNYSTLLTTWLHAENQNSATAGSIILETSIRIV